MFDQLVLATRNQDKVREIRNLLAGLEISILDMSDFPGVPEVIEDGDTLAANALKKAREVFQHTGLPAVADDTGLEVDYLNGAPGVFSARYAGEAATYSDNVTKLLRELDGIPNTERTARFRCVVAIVSENIEEVVSGSCAGIILSELRGDSGFGYDPVFFVPEVGLTFSEMSLSKKNGISHRGRAFRKFKDFLTSIQVVQEFQ